MDSRLFGARLREARERAGLSQGELAEIVSRDQGAISEYENGKRRLSALDLPEFAQALGVPILYFYEGMLAPDDLDSALLKVFRTLPTDEAKNTAIEILRAFSRSIGLHYR